MRPLLLFVASVMAMRSALDACSCRSRNICEKLDLCDVIFRGEVVAGGLEPGEDPWSGRAKFAKLRVVEVFRGIPRDTKLMTVPLFFARGMCSAMPYRRGEQTLVFIRRYEGRIGDGGCTMSRPLRDFTDELEYLRRYFGGQTSTSFRGRVFGYSEPVSHALVMAYQETWNSSTVTDEQGRFEFAQLEPGTYRIVASKEGYTSTDGMFPVTVKNKGCAIRDVVLLPRNSLEGAVFDHRGNSVGDLAVFLRSARQPDHWGRQAVTDKRGRFRYEHVDPGRYNLVVSPKGATPESPFDAAYYRRPTSRGEAEEIEIGTTSQLSSYFLIVGPQLPRHVVSVRVVGAYGGLVESADIDCTEVGATDSEFWRSGSRSRGTGGFVNFRVLANHRYKVSVFTRNYPRSAALAERLIEAGREDVKIEIRLSLAEAAAAATVP